MLNTVANVGRVLDLFDRDSAEWGVTEVGRELQIPKSNAHALLVSLVEIGVLARTSRNRYRLGWRVVSLSERVRHLSGLGGAARPVMVTTAKSLGETVLLAVLERDRALYVDRVDGAHPTVRLAGVRIGGSLPLHSTAVGKILLSDRTLEEAREILGEGPLHSTTDRTICDVDVLLESLRRVRRDGVAYDRCETVHDACALAVPIRDDQARIVAALSTAIPAYRFEAIAERARVAIDQAATSITQRLNEKSASPR